jgi:hypothetical protein
MPRFQRAKHRKIAPWPDGAPDADDVADRAVYVGSAEHKAYPSTAGQPALRSDATPCDPAIGADRITPALKDSIRNGRTSGVFEGGFPKYVWGLIDQVVYEARHINGPTGTYKGYPIEPAEYPDDPEGRLNLE